MNDPPARWTAVKELFGAACDLPEHEREAFVRGQPVLDASVQVEVLRLLALESEAGSFLETPAAAGLPSIVADPPFLLAPGERLANRYRIVEAIGRGGMGEVYEAFDEVMHETLAVKIARSPGPLSTSLVDRWRREVHLARKVSHHGVCRVHDVATDDGPHGELLFLTMERLRGESLRTRLARGPIPEKESMLLGRQIAQALDAAHACGVLHRDVKPDNVVVDTEATPVRVVLTDFGLARELGPSAVPLTQVGWVTGTPGYIAPELLRGEAPSTASDGYALAVVVRHMLTTARPAFSPAVSAVFTAALASEPSARFQTGAAFIDALQSAITGPTAGSRHRSRWWIAVGAMAALALIGAALRFYIGETPHLATSSEVLLTDMANDSGETELDGAGEILRSQLTLSPHFELLDSDRVRHALVAMGRPVATSLTPEVAREVALREGASLVAYPALARLGQDHVVSIKLEAVGPRPTLSRRTWTQSFTASSKAGIFDAIHDGAMWVRRMAGEAASTLGSQDRSPAETTTSSWDALSLYKQAEAFGTAGRLSDAVLLLQSALRLDPKFAIAHMRLADDLISLKRDKEGYAEWQTAVDLADRQESSSREALRIRSQYFDDTGNLVEAERADRTYTLLYPNDGTAAFLLGHVLVELDRLAEAGLWLEKARNLQPLALTPSVHLALYDLDTGRGADAEAAIAHLDAIGGSDWALWLRGLRATFRGDVDEALRTVEPLRKARDLLWQSRVSTLRASWLTEAGREPEAMAELQHGIDFDDAQGFRDRMADKLLMLAELRARSHDERFAGTALKALDVAMNARRVAAAVGVLARGGHVSEARSLMKRFEGLPDVPAAVEARHRAEAELLVTEKRPTEAVAAFDAGLAVAPRRSQTRLPLIRAIVAADDASRAADLLWTIIEHPATVYPSPEPQTPGPMREAIELLLRLPERDPERLADLQKKYAQFIRH